jgi:hypothetical protein
MQDILNQRFIRMGEARHQHQWLTLEALPQEAEIRRFTVQGQPGQIVRDSISKIPNTKKEW